MEPIFPKWTNKIPIYTSIIGVFLVLLSIFIIWYYLSPKFLAEGYQPVQPIAFSHQMHAGKLGIDCRYCHSSVEKTAFATLPSTATCEGCHNKVIANDPRVKLLRDSFKNKKTIPWEHIYTIPRYSHFDHSAHLNAGVACVSCHGRIDKMQSVFQVTPLSMGWCLECHRNPTPNLVPQNELTNMIYNPHKNSYVPLKDLNPKTQNIQAPESCGSCHY